MQRWIPIALVSLIPLATACADPAPEAGTDRPAAEAAAPEQAGERAGEEVVYVDVRSPEEYASGHVVGAINIPHTEMRQRHEELEPFADREIVLYCRSGRRSGIAQRILEEEGFDNLTNGGGFADLRARGVPSTR